MMSPSKLHLEVSLDKELYYHGEMISVNVHIQNNSNKPVKKIKVSVRQFADILLFSTAQYKCTVSELESEEGFPIGSGSTLNKANIERNQSSFAQIIIKLQIRATKTVGYYISPIKIGVL